MVLLATVLLMRIWHLVGHAVFCTVDRTPPNLSLSGKALPLNHLACLCSYRTHNAVPHRDCFLQPGTVTAPPFEMYTSVSVKAGDRRTARSQHNLCRGYVYHKDTVALLWT